MYSDILSLLLSHLRSTTTKTHFTMPLSEAGWCKNPEVHGMGLSQTHLLFENAEKFLQKVVLRVTYWELTALTPAPLQCNVAKISVSSSSSSRAAT